MTIEEENLLISERDYLKSRIPRKIRKLPDREREILDKLLFDDGKLITKRGLVRERHRPLSVKQIVYIMKVCFDIDISSKTLYKYLKVLE